MGAQGTATLNFGAFPGSNVAVTDVAAPGVISSSAVEAWVRPETTADHSDGDHIAAPMQVTGQYLSDGNIRIFGINLCDVDIPVEVVRVKDRIPMSTVRTYLKLDRKQNRPMFVGAYSVNWVWN